jgi:prophage antirepressor-like protein
MTCKFIYPKTGKQCTKLGICTNGCCKTHSSYYNKIQKQMTEHTNTEHTNTEHTNTEHTNTEHTNTEHTNTEHTNTEHTNTEHTNTEHTNKICKSYFTINNSDFNYIINNSVIYFDGEEIATYIGYSNHVKAINDHINTKYIKKLEEIFKHNDSLSLEKNKKNKIYISEYGLYQLLATSKLKNNIITQFQDTLYESILPSIRTTGSYVNEVIPINETIQLSLYDKKNVIYIGFIPKLGCYKFGISSDIKQRNEAHQKTFKNFKICYIRECNNNNYVENLFKSDLRNLDLLYSHDTYSELFIISEQYNEIYIYNLLDNIIQEHIIKNNLMEEIELRKIDLLIKIEETKQLELFLKIKQLTNYKCYDF